MQPIQSTSLPSYRPERSNRRGGPPKPPLDGYQGSVIGETPGLMPRLRPARLDRIDEQRERDILSGSGGAARLVPLASAPGNAPATITIHGINGAPSDLQEVSEAAAARGEQVLTLAYDDRFRRLTDSSAELAQHLGNWLRENPGRPLRLAAHSMGSRLALSALDRLQQQGLLEGRSIQFDLLAPPLAGFASADWARMDLTGVLGGLIGGVRPGQDMGANSSFQRHLEGIRLPNNVRTRIFLGGRDRLIDPQQSAFQRVVENLGAQVVEIPEAGHSNLPAYVAAGT